MNYRQKLLSIPLFIAVNSLLLILELLLIGRMSIEEVLDDFPDLALEYIQVFFAFAAGGINHCGITYCNQKRRSIGEILNTLNLIWQALEPEDMKNQLEFL